MTLLEAADLRMEARTGRGMAHILRGVTLRVAAGQILGVVGESGSGKSSLALAVMRLLPANVSGLSGRLALAGEDLIAASPGRMAALRGTQLAMVFQDPATALNPVFTVGTQLVDVIRRREPGVGRRAALARAEDALRRVEVADPALRLRAYPHELSGGMRQRVLIAMALLVQPALLIADEPTTALDATVEAGIVALFGRLRTELGGSILFISHQLGLVAALCDAIAVMYGGLVVEQGPAAALCAAPKHPYTAALLRCEPDAQGDGRLHVIGGEVPDPHDALPGCVFAPRCPLVEQRCRVEPQALRPMADGWAAACWKAQ